MACPLFIPTTPLGELVTIAPPLGDLYTGHCSADPAAAIESETQRRCCNFGYARGRCDRAAQSEADAVRFLIRAERGNIVEVAWAVERDHHPVAVGVTEVEAAAGPAAGDALTMQAFACAASYVRQVRGVPTPMGRASAAVHQ